MKFNKRCNRFIVISSDYEPVPVGSVLLDNKNERIADWTVINTETGASQTFVGRKIDRACPECANLGWAAVPEHAGEHGEDAPRLPPVKSDEHREDQPNLTPEPTRPHLTEEG